ncbi:U-box domain-containing protein 17-like [Nymphaea colorata]|uniref:U-box domain-containing protein 17-like n=1 Tax=Nymphaea colorata TaxID=210225 RepID=UPI00129E895E|nr:U-box domain-containing protein 17-like [Nymphaea colorata]
MGREYPVVPPRSLASLCDQIAPLLPIPVFFLRRHSLSLLRKVQLLSLVLRSVTASSPSASSALCLRELHAVLTKALNLVQFCHRSSRVHLLLLLPQLSIHFHDIGLDISTVFDVLPPGFLLDLDLRENALLLRRRSEPPCDPKGDRLRHEIIAVLDELRHERPPDPEDLRRIFFELGLQNRDECDDEMERLREVMMKTEEQEPEPSLSLVDLFCVVRYAKQLLFGIECSGASSVESADWESEKEEPEIPEDYRCPISLELMRDPVTVSTGQTYDRSSITHWLETGHVTCPKSGQLLKNTELVPNLALRSLISRWCTEHSIPFDESSEAAGAGGAGTLAVINSKPAIEATRLTALFLVDQLRSDLPSARTHAACELRVIARSGSPLIRAAIVNAGAIPLLVPLLDCGDPVAEENSVTAILNLSIHDGNKEPIVSAEGCLEGIIRVLRFGSTETMRENAAAALFSLSSAAALKERIASEPGAVDGLVELVRSGSIRARRDAVSALFNIATKKDNVPRVVMAGGTDAVVELLRETDGGLAEEAAAVVAMLARQADGIVAVVAAPGGISALVWVLRTGSPKAKEHAVAALLELCRHGGQDALERVARAPLLVRSLHSLLYSGTSRAKRKAASLVRICGGCCGLSATTHSMPVSLAVSVPFR